MNNEKSAIETPWARVNQLTGGLHQGELWAIGGITATGKTSMALNIAEHAILNQKQRVKIVSYESSNQDLLLNMFCTRAMVDLQTVWQGKLTPYEKRRLTEAFHEFSNDRCDFLDIGGSMGSTALAISKSLQQNVTEGRPADLLIVDSLQALHGAGPFRTRREELYYVVFELKEIAQQFQILVILLAQLNTRSLEEAPPTPQLSEFSEADAIAWSADVVWILRRINDEQQDLPIQRTDAFLLKQRDGRTGKIPFKFHAAYRHFEEIPEHQPKRSIHQRSPLTLVNKGSKLTPRPLAQWLLQISPK